MRELHHVSKRSKITGVLDKWINFKLKETTTFSEKKKCQMLQEEDFESDKICTLFLYLSKEAYFAKDKKIMQKKS